MTYFIFTLGCQMNISDSQRIARVLESCGLKPSSEKEADLIVVNACSVRQSAVDRIYGKLKNWPGKKILITGCVLPHDKEKLAQKVDLIFDIKDLPKLPRLLSKIFDKNYHAIPPLIPKTYNLKPRGQSQAFVPIMTGCDNFCSYCAVPYTRGREVSRPEKEIIKEVKELISQGVKEITLLGQNVNSYGKKIKMQKSKLSKKPPFVQLLEKLVKIPGDFKIKFLTSNPWDFSNELIDIIAKEPKISKEIHLPVQSGDDEILRKMNRPYTVEQYLKLISNLKSQISNLYLSTDIIVGFPSETKKAFENTIKLCKKAKFAKAYIAQYSPRPGTAAYKLKDNVSKEEKKSRWKILNKLINKKLSASSSF
jgi:tRNA-2-methylthio-N6-dimethylallyladenosine synthase